MRRCARCVSDVSPVSAASVAPGLQVSGRRRSCWRWRQGTDPREQERSAVWRIETVGFFTETSRAWEALFFEIRCDAVHLGGT